MLWSVHEAVSRQTVQIGASACGATAVVDVLRALGVAVAPEEADRCVRTRLRRNQAPLKDYLHSRSQAGATHAQLILGAELASGGHVMGRFFPLHPRRRVRLVPWLARWIRRGAVPVATMNMQRAVPGGGEVPDAWHHQLIYGVGPNAIYMTNPLDLVSEGEVHQRLCSESVLLIRREDVLKRLTATPLLSSLSEGQSDSRWNALDVEGQVRQMIREEDLGDEDQGDEDLGDEDLGDEDQVVDRPLMTHIVDRPLMTHIVIPAAYSSGVTFFSLRDSAVGRELLQAPDLPSL